MNPTGSTTDGLVAAVGAGVAAHGLRGARAGFPDRPLTPHAWRALVHTAQAHRLQGLLGSAVADGALPATDEQADEALGAQLDAAAGSLLRERALLRVACLLDAVGVQYRVLKGAAYARLVYPDPVQRPFGDVDLLVHADDLDEACRHLERQRYRRRGALRAGSTGGRYSAATTLVSPDGIGIDLHHTLAQGPYSALVPPDDLWAGGQDLTIGSYRLTALGPPVRFLHACLQCTAARPTHRYLSLRDVAQTALDPATDADAVGALADKWKARAVVASALHDTWEVLGLADALRLHHDADRYRASKTEDRLLALHSAQAAGGGVDRALLRALPGFRAKAGVLLGRRHRVTSRTAYRSGDPPAPGRRP